MEHNLEQNRNAYHTWENFWWGKNWQIWMSYSPKVFLANIHRYQKCIWHMHWLPYTEKFWQGKSGEIGKLSAIRQIFLANIPKMHFAYALTLAYSPNFSSPIAFTCIIRQISPIKYFPFYSSLFAKFFLTNNTYQYGMPKISPTKFFPCTVFGDVFLYVLATHNHTQLYNYVFTYVYRDP